jgi:hypothetical protein
MTELIFSCSHEPIKAELDYLRQHDLNFNGEIELAIYPAGLTVRISGKDQTSTFVTLGEIKNPLLFSKILNDREKLHWFTLLKAVSSYPGQIKVVRSKEFFYLVYRDRNGEEQRERID